MERCSSTWITSDVLPAGHHSDFKALRNLPNLDYFSKDNRDSLRTHVGSHWVNVITLPLNQHGSVWISNIWIRQFPVVIWRTSVLVLLLVVKHFLHRFHSLRCFFVTNLWLNSACDWLVLALSCAQTGWRVIRPIWRLNESKCSSSCRLTLLLLLFVFDSMLACVLTGFIWSPRALFSCCCCCFYLMVAK